MENIYVNITGAPLVVSLPSGASYSLNSGEAIVGNWFEKYTKLGTPLLVRYTPRVTNTPKVHNPLKLASIPVNPAPQPVAAAVPPAAEPETFKVAAAATVQVQAGIAQEAEPGPDSIAAATTPADEYLGKTMDQWKDWFATVTESTVLQTYKLHELVDLASFLGLDPAAIGTTKLDVQAAVRNHLLN
jgi:hypothetical protein